MTSDRQIAPPHDPLAAVTHPDPYPYYADLAANRPLERDETLGLWVAAGAGAVEAVLASDLCRVRPPAEPVPRAIAGSPAGEIFRRLVRMVDGADHCPWKLAVTATLSSVDGPRAEAASRAGARRLLAGMSAERRPEAILELAFRLPVDTVGSLLGVDSADGERIARQIGDFAACLQPAATVEAVERGKAAAGELLDRFRALAARRDAATDGGLVAALARQARHAGRDDPEAVAANAIGFLFQAYEATAGLLGNTLLALAMRPELAAAARRDPSLLRGVVQEVLRHDPPVQNTRRFVARAGSVAGREMREGEAILVVLAAANRDPAANPHPERFDARRRERRIFTFGAGPHACPGEALAATIAVAGIETLLAAGIDLAELAGPVVYRPSANLRIPLFGRREPAGR